MWTQLVLLPIAFFIALRLFRLAANYSAARKFGLPIIVLPASFEDPWWNILKPILPWVERLPFGLGSWYFYTDLGWPMIDGIKTTARLGETFVLVSPTSVQIVTAYPPAVDTIFKDHKRWIRPAAFGQLLAIYGQNLISTNGAEWQRHRKITGSAFNERTMRSVWDEAGHSAIKALNYTEVAERSIHDVRSDLESLALGVLTSVAFGQNTDVANIAHGHHQTLVECLSSILKNVFTSIAFTKIKVPDALLPSFLKHLKSSIAEFQLYMEESVLRQIQSPISESKQNKSTTLLEAMINSNEAGKRENTKQEEVFNQSTKSSYLSDSELYGNLFIFNLAGYETTAGTMTFTLPYLAAYPEIQRWITEEIDNHYAAAKEVSYDEVYAKLVRCLALMYETLRVASTAPQIVRAPAFATELPIPSSEGGDSITVPAGTIVSVHIDGLHLSPRWGANAHEFDPKRFVSTSSLGEEKLSVPGDATYVAWVLGPRACPGKKFSQVEFVAVIAHILFLYRVEVVNEEHELDEVAENRLRNVLKDKYFNGSAHLRKPGNAKIRFVRRRA